MCCTRATHTSLFEFGMRADLLDRVRWELSPAFQALSGFQPAKSAAGEATQCSLQILDTLGIAVGPAAVGIDEAVLESNPAMPAHRSRRDQRGRFRCTEGADPPVETRSSSVVLDFRNEWSEFGRIAFLSGGVAAKRKNHGVTNSGDDPALHEIEQVIKFIRRVDNMLHGDPLRVRPSIQLRGVGFRARIR